MQPSGADRGDPNILALLSLKLLLLGFFILLNALSQYEEDRARKVLESVNEAFNGRVEALESRVPYSAGLGSLEETAAVVGAVGRLFESLIPAVRREVSDGGTRLRLELPAESLFRPGDKALQPGRGLLLRRFAWALTRDGRADLDYQVELLHGAPTRPEATPAAGAGTLEVRRMGALVRHLIRYGVPADKLSIGVLPDRPGKVQLVVQLREGPVPAPDYGERAK